MYLRAGEAVSSRKSLIRREETWLGVWQPVESANTRLRCADGGVAWGVGVGGGEARARLGIIGGLGVGPSSGMVAFSLSFSLRLLHYIHDIFHNIHDFFSYYS